MSSFRNLLSGALGALLLLAPALSAAQTITPGGNVLSTPVAVAEGGTGSTTAPGARTNLGLGTAATQNTGTSGANVPLLNGANTWSSAQIFSSSVDGSYFNSTGGNIYFGATNNTGPRLKRSTTGLDLKLGDDSAYTTLRASFVYLNNASVLSDSADGVIRLTNSLQTGLTRVTLGPATSSFGAFAPSGTGTIQAVLGDGSALTRFDASALRTPPVAFSALITCGAGTDGLRQAISDGSLPMSGNYGAVAAGGGANHVPVYCDATSWKIGKAGNIELPAAINDNLAPLWAAFG